VSHTVVRSAVKHAGQSVVSRSWEAERGKTTVPADAVYSGVGSVTVVWLPRSV
jgi:hypothetical protein